MPAESQIPGLEVERDGQRVATATWGTAIPVDPGKRAVAARAPGRTPWSASFDIATPGNTIIAVPPLAEVGGAPRHQPTPADSGPHTLSTIGWMSLGGGAVGLGLGVAFAFVAASKGSDADAICPIGACAREEIARYNGAYKDAQTAVTTAQVALGLGVVFAAAGAVLLWTGRTRNGANVTRSVVASW